ncbi:MAG: ArsR/SmtB family transcription factor [Desulfonatronovibrio sp.]
MIYDSQGLARIFNTLSSPARVRILELIKSRSLCVSSLAEELGVTSAAVSQHLRILRDAGLAVGEKKGYHVHYQANQENMKKWQKKIRLFFEPPLS